jgi:hypothetical protein
MTQGVKNLIDAIASGDSLAIDAAFNSEMANRISERLDDMRAEVAQTMFHTESVQVDEEAELNLEDYSVEEVEEFMQTEDFEQLDELSKDTLKSYVGKAAHDVGNKMYNAGSLGQQAAKHGNDGAQKTADHVGKEARQQHSKALTRLQGIKKAADKLAK